MLPLKVGLLVALLISAFGYFLFEAGRNAVLSNLQKFAGGGVNVVSKSQHLIVLATCCGVLVLAHIMNFQEGNVAFSVSGPSQERAQDDPSNVAAMDADIARLKGYLSSAGDASLGLKTRERKSEDGGLPDVETMIARLETRLKAEPDDVEGWRTLGWSYLNTAQPFKAVIAYQKAIEIAPNRSDLAEALESAQKIARNKNDGSKLGTTRSRQDNTNSNE